MVVGRARTGSHRRVPKEFEEKGLSTEQVEEDFLAMVAAE